VYVLNRQVEEITDGAISAKAMGIGLSVGVSISLGLAMIRVLTGISILWFLIPGYALALIISFFVPKIYTAIAFDSGGVASGPMTAAFLLPLAQGACTAVGGNMVTDAFGVVAMVAMTPLITIQVMGLAATLMQRRKTETAAPAAFADMDENAIIEL
jgi:putative membrane protein